MALQYVLPGAAAGAVSAVTALWFGLSFLGALGVYSLVGIGLAIALVIADVLASAMQNQVSQEQHKPRSDLAASAGNSGEDEKALV